ncbi:MAG: LCP family protein, partial [Candidatus Saccharimonadales bacterium]
MRLPGDGGHQPVHHRIRSIKKWTFRTATALAVVVLLIGGFLFSKGYLQLHRVFTGGSSAAALNAEVNPDQLKGEGSGRVNILLLGIGGPGHDGPDLTDTMMIASIDVVNHRIGLLSIPRDLWIKEPNNFVENYGKINAAYESGKYQYLGHDDSSNGNINAIKAGFKTVDQTMSRIAGIPINYNALVNFQAFQQAVDAVGGVTINVPTELYDPTMAWQNNWNPVLAKKGVQYM